MRATRASWGQAGGKWVWQLTGVSSIKLSEPALWNVKQLKFSMLIPGFTMPHNVKSGINMYWISDSRTRPRQVRWVWFEKNNPTHRTLTFVIVAHWAWAKLQFGTKWWAQNLTSKSSSENRIIANIRTFHHRSIHFWYKNHQFHPFLCVRSLMMERVSVY